MLFVKVRQIDAANLGEKKVMRKHLKGENGNVSVSPKNALNTLFS